MDEILRLEELAAKLPGVESRVEEVNGRDHPRHFGVLLLLSIRGGEYHSAEVRAFGPLQVESRLLDRRVIATFQVIREAEREPIHRNELGVDAQRELEVLDRRVRLT